MKPAEVIYFIALGIAIILVIGMLFLLFRKNKKIAATISVSLLLLYIGYYFYYPTLQENKHAARYELLQAYLQETYPERQFTVYPKNLEPGVDAGHFMVNDLNTPEIGVDLLVKKDGTVTQTSFWHKNDFLTQKRLWETVKYQFESGYSLDQEVPTVVKKDVWIDGELTVFALTVNNKPNIAIFNYSMGGYRSFPRIEGSEGDIVTANYQQYEFFYIDEHYPESTASIQLASGEMKAIDVAEIQGKLLVYP